MAVKKKSRQKKKSTGGFSFQLSWGGLAGVSVVAFCLFLWMFILGVWAGQTILLPPAEGSSVKTAVNKKASPIRLHGLKTIEADSKKRAVN